MSDLAINRAEVERIKKRADELRYGAWEGDEAAESSADILIEFCDVLLGDTTVEGFLRSQDMEG